MSTPPDADRYAHLELELSCPKCSGAGLIPWQHLDRILFCNGCSAFFRVERHALIELQTAPREKISVQVRSISSDWQAHKALVETAPTLRGRLGSAALELIFGSRIVWITISATVLLMIAVGWQASHPPQPEVVEIPDSLTDRAVLLAEALVRRDTNLMLQMTDPTQHRTLRVWLAHAANLPRRIPRETEIEEELLSTAKTTANGNQVEVRVGLRVPPDDKQVVVEQTWVKRADVWYFRPVVLRTSARRMPPPPPRQRGRAR